MDSYKEGLMLVVLTIVNMILIACLFTLSLRIVIGWFAPQSLGKAWAVLVRATDPYLRLFGRMRFLKTNLFDYSPIVAILALVVVLDLVNRLLYYGRITLGFFLASVLSAAWSGLRFVIVLFFVLCVLRTIPFIFRATTRSSVWKVVDTIVQPVVAWVTGVFRLGRSSGYVRLLLFTIGLLLMACLLGEVLARLIVSLLQVLPV